MSDLTMPEPDEIRDDLADEAPDVALIDETPDPAPDDDAPVLPASVTAIIRTVVPYVIAGLVWLLAKVGLDVELPAGTDVFLTTVIGTLYYMAARQLEKRWPQVPWLGSTRQPLYTAPARLADVSTLASTGYVWHKGGKFSPAFRDMLIELDRLTPDVPIVITQGGFNGTSVSASAGTHAGDAVDISVRGLTQAQVTKLVSTARKLGLAMYFRTTKVGKWGTRAQGFGSYHLHGVPNGWGSPSAAARRQISYTDSNGTYRGYRNGRDGLASNGVDAGPGHTGAYRTRTWAGYLASKTGLPATGAVGPIPRSYTPKPWAAIAEDGLAGPATWRRVQAQLSVATTGKLDHYTVRALKVWLGFADDGVGILYPSHIRALQKRVGARVDGIWKPTATTTSPTTRAFQRYLNGHR